MGRALRDLRRVGFVGGGGRRADGLAAGARPRRVRPTGPCPSPRSTSPSTSPGPPGSTSSTGCSAAAWCRGRSRSSAASRGSGKSTLLTQVAAAVAAGGERVLYVSAEESRQQVRLRAERLGALAPGLWLADRRCRCTRSSGHLDEVKPSLLVVDSIQSVHDLELPGGPGSVTQVKGCAQRLVAEAKSRSVAVVLVGHVTKDGDLAGPRALEHVVDTVLGFEGDRHHGLRLLRSVKHRFGPTGELGMFELTEHGLVGVPDAGGPAPGRPPPGRGRVGGRAGHRGQPAPARRGPGPRRRGRARQPAPLGPGHRRPASRHRAWRCSTSASGASCGAPTCSPWPPAASGCTSRRPTSPSPSPSLRRSRDAAARRRRGVRRGRPRRRGSAGEPPRPPPQRGRPHGLPPGRRAHARPPTVPAGMELPDGCPRSAMADQAPAVSRGAGTVRAMPDSPSRPRLLDALAAVAPGTGLREGLDRILQASMGALVVVGDGPEVLNICSGGFLLDAAFSPQRLSELAKMDGAIILAADASRIARANVHLVPNPNTPTSETGTRHRTAERVARSIAVPVMSVSEDMQVINVYVGDDKYPLGRDPPPPQPGQPGPLDPGALQGPARHRAGRPLRARGRGPRHPPRRGHGAAAHRDGPPHRRGARSSRSSSSATTAGWSACSSRS